MSFPDLNIWWQVNVKQLLLRFMVGIKWKKIIFTKIIKKIQISTYSKKRNWKINLFENFIIIESTLHILDPNLISCILTNYKVNLWIFIFLVWCFFFNFYPWSKFSHVEKIYNYKWFEFTCISNNNVLLKIISNLSNSLIII